jgi:hypothetical protein
MKSTQLPKSWTKDRARTVLLYSHRRKEPEPERKLSSEIRAILCIFLDLRRSLESADWWT